MAKNRIERDKDLISFMIKLYCRKSHKTKEPCGQCRELNSYAQKRLENCKYGDQKSYCGKCPSKCYTPEMSEKMRRVMSFSGKRLITRRPIAAFRYILKI